MGLTKSAAYLASPAACRLRKGDNVGAARRFRPGHVPANKGLRRPGWSTGRMAETQFKKSGNATAFTRVFTKRLGASPSDWLGRQSKEQKDRGEVE